ncbi:hypothetical protein EX30DRAFT_312267 [Ascodesmis nigricans]|uniref:Sulfate transporter n=1 Tax=Ascodesmis nigricans TaxID=341454 RepID=A0A4S2MN04_9PEZI|nr:hypothetical protein EX30DRAFT_312267 [Ascodesmis nigricans]
MFVRGVEYLWHSTLYNWTSMRRNALGELSGSLGDLGTLLPIMVALTAAKSISLSSTLIFSGIFNIISGTVFGIPIAVQPMKAVASIVLARHLTLEENMAAGIGVAVIVLLLSITGLLSKVSVLIPIPIIKGVQLGAGFSLVLNAGATMSKLSLNSDEWYDSQWWTVGAFIVLFGTCRWPQKVPYAILIFSLGLLMSAIRLARDEDDMPKFRINWPFDCVIPTLADFATGFSTAGLGQVPLTVLNSVIAVAYLSNDLLPERPAPSVTALGMSVAIMNLVGCWFGAMPVCHGSGGLAGQYRFGARSGASVQILGIAKIAIGVCFGDSLTGLFENFPASLLGVMVFAAGMELISVGEDLNTTAADLYRGPDGRRPGHIICPPRALEMQTRRDRYLIMMVTAGITIGFKNSFIGFIAGCVCWALLEAQNRMDEWGDDWDEAGSEISTETTPLLGS